MSATPLASPAPSRSAAPAPAAPPTTAEWVKCPACGWLVYGRRLVRNLHVCPECGHHRRIGARERIAQLTDPGSFAELGQGITAADPLQFTDSRPYRERIAEARAKTGEEEGAVFGTASIEGSPVVLLVMDFGFMGGSMGSGIGDAVASAAESAHERRRPLVLVCASGGARMQEGALSLLQMAKTSQAMADLADAGLLSVCVLTDPTFGGVTASFATLGDVLVAESGALVGFAGPRVIAQTIREDLPEGFQTAEFLLAHGLVDRVETRAALRPLLARLLRMHPAPARPWTGARGALGGQRPSADRPATDRPGPDRSTADRPAAERPGAATDGAPRALRPATTDPWDVVRTARDPGRPTALDYLGTAFDDFVELHGDRAYGDDPAVVGGVARIGDRSVVVVGHQKGHDTRELVARSFGMPHPEGYRKAMRLMDHAERLGLPVVTLVDTPGAYPGVRAEEHGQAHAIAAIIARATRLRVPTVSVVTGEGGSGGALALATTDRLLMLANAFYSVISPEGCAAILWRTPEAAPDAARALRMTAPDLVGLGIADAVVPEPSGGAQADPLQAASLLRTAVLAALEDLTALDVPQLLSRRHQRFRSVGAAVLQAPEVHSA